MQMTMKILMNTKKHKKSDCKIFCSHKGHENKTASLKTVDIFV